MNPPPSDNLLPDLTSVIIPPQVVVPGVEKRVPSATAIARVLHIINGEHYAGAERVQDLLAQYLPQYGFEVAFACVKPRHFAESRQSQMTPLYNFPMRNRLDLGVAKEIARIVKQEGYSLIHSHSVRTALVGRLAAKLAGVPMVYHVHSPASRDTTRSWMNWINSRVERVSLRRAGRIIAVSESLKLHMIRQGFESSRISVVHNGVPTLYEIPFRGPPRGQWILGTAALFRPRKGIEILLQALSQLRKRGLPVRLRAVGKFESAEYERKIHGLVVDLGLEDIIEWTGFSSDVTSELLRLDLFILPSLFGEGLPMVLLEAMAAGVPIVATDVGGVSESIRHGQDGLLVPAGDPKAIVQAVAEVIDAKYDWSAMRESALERQVQDFSHSSMAEGVAEVYRQVLDT